MAKVRLKSEPLPVSPVKAAAKKMIEDKKGPEKILAAGKDAKKVSGTVTEKVMLKEFIPSNVSAMKGPQGKSKMSSAELIDAGLFKSMDGDLVPTAKYQALKKSGGLGKYGIQ
jgi:hypothetical protein